MTQNNDTQALRLSFEYFPPQSDSADTRLWQAIGRHSTLQPEFVSVTYGAGGTTQDRTLKTLQRLQNETQLDAAGHLTIIGKSRDEVLDISKKYREFGVNRIVALRGDKPKNAPQFEPHPEGFQSSIELIEALSIRDFDISVGCYPETHPEAENTNSDLAFLKRKFEAGADRAISQFFFEKDAFLRFRDQAAKIGIEKPIIPGILPIENFEKMKNFANACGASVPPWLCAAFENADTAEAKHILAVSLACDMIENLRAEGVDHVHIYTLNNPELTHDIGVALGLQDCRTPVKCVA